MKKLIVLTLTFFLCCSSVYSQVNLVKNPSLEDHWRCPVLLDEIALANYWSCIDTLHTYPALGDTFGDPNCTPEYINACAISSCCSEPHNGYFYQFPRTGFGMAQMMMYSDQTYTQPYYRDYLQGRLYSTLTAGQSYCVTFYVVMENGSSYAVNHMGAYFDDGSVDTNSYCGMPHPECLPQVVSTT